MVTKKEIIDKVLGKEIDDAIKFTNKNSYILDGQHTFGNGFSYHLSKNGGSCIIEMFTNRQNLVIECQ